MAMALAIGKIFYDVSIPLLNYPQASQSPYQPGYYPYVSSVYGANRNRSSTRSMLFISQCR
jgi:hypothetical protein